MREEELKTPQLPKDIAERVDRWIERYPAERQSSGVFEALRLVQERNGHLTTEWMDAVADHLNMPRVAVYEVATFYTMYYLQPVGKHIFNVCTNISCMLNGSDQLAEHIKKRLGVDFNQTTADGKFTLKEVECLGACVAAPVCMVDKTFYEKVTPEIADQIIAEVGE